MRWLLRGSVLLLVLVGLYLSLFFLPYPLFPHHEELAGFEVYSDAKLPADLQRVFEDARGRVEAMELFRGTRPPRFFLCRSHWRCALIVRSAGKRRVGQGMVISAAGNAFLSLSIIESVGRRNDGAPEHSRLEGSLAGAVAHEVAHYLMGIELGRRRARSLPVWIAEGYADYSANLAPARADPQYDLNGRVALLLDEAHWQSPAGRVDRRHFGWHVLVEFLLTIEGLEFEDLLSGEVGEAQVWDRMVAWSREAASAGASAHRAAGVKCDPHALVVLTDYQAEAVGSLLSARRWHGAKHQLAGGGRERGRSQESGSEAATSISPFR